MPRDTRMTPRQLRRHIKRLNPDMPHHKALDCALLGGAEGGGVWYKTQKQHLLGWLREYNGPGAYGRKVQHGRDAKFVYNHFQCASALFWLAEALELPDETLDTAYKAIIDAPPRSASQCGAFRKVVPWEMIEEALYNRPKSGIMAWFSRRLF